MHAPWAEVVWHFEMKYGGYTGVYGLAFTCETFRDD